MIDTHCHLDSKYFPEGAAEPIARAQAEGVTAFICIGVGSLERARETAALPEAHASVVATVGLHPHEAEEFQEAQLAEYAAMGRGDKIVAIGEIVLDYYYEHSPKQQQQAVFRKFIALAKELKKPIVIHTRDAPQDTLAILN